MYQTNRLIISLALAVLGTNPAAPSGSDIRTLLAQLNEPSMTDGAAREIVQVASKDPAARKHIAQQLPRMIARPETDEIWLNAVRLAGKLKATEAIPSLRKAISRGLLGGPANMTFSREIDLDDDIVAKALSEIGDAALPTVTELLNSGDPKERRRAVLILRNMTSPAAHKALQNRLQYESDPRIKDLIETGLRS
jgi:HEAT repeat protein